MRADQGRKQEGCQGDNSDDAHRKAILRELTRLATLRARADGTSLLGRNGASQPLKKIHQTTSNMGSMHGSVYLKI